MDLMFMNLNVDLERFFVTSVAVDCIRHVQCLLVRESWYLPAFQIARLNTRILARNASL